MSAGTYSQSAPRQSPTLLRYGNSTRAFDKLMLHVTDRTAYFICEAASPRTTLRVGSVHGLAESARPLQPQRDRRCLQAKSALAGSGRTPPVSRVRENRMHGSLTIIQPGASPLNATQTIVAQHRSCLRTNQSKPVRPPSGELIGRHPAG